MMKGLIGYLYKGSTVVLSKKYINNAKDEEFAEVRVFINEADIKQLSENIGKAIPKVTGGQS